MNKKEFLAALKVELAGYDEAEVQELLAEYEDHFAAGVADKRSEEEIAEKLGDPKTIAREFKTATLVKKAESKPTPSNVSKALFAFVGLGFFNLVFVIGPYMGAIGLLIGGFAASLGMVVGGLGGMIASVVAPFVNGTIELGVSPVVGFFGSLSVSCFGALLGIGMYYITKLFLILTLKYIKLNLDIVTGGSK